MTSDRCEIPGCTGTVRVADPNAPYVAQSLCSVHRAKRLERIKRVAERRRATGKVDL